jgi:methylmalonyl-CoA mutase
MANQSSSLPASTEALSALLSQWRKTVETELQGVPFEKKLVTKTAEGIALQPLYTRADLAQVPHLDARPGQAPFIRGFDTLGYKKDSWECAQEISAKDAASFNSALLSDLMKGQNSVVLKLDVATRQGSDADQAPAAQVGACGLSISDVKDLAEALGKVNLSAIPVHVHAGADALAFAGLYLSYAQQAGVQAKALTGSLTADPIATLASSGKLAVSEASLFDNLATWSKFAAANAPKLRTVGVCARGWHEAGANSVQELAFSLATAVEYIRALSARGVSPAQTAGQIRFCFAVGPTFFMEVSKFRAFRLLWARVMSAFGAEAAAAGAFVHARTGQYSQTVHDPHVNMLRVTTEALSAVLGGVNSLHIAPYDELAGTSDEFSRRIARNVHTLIAEEFGFTENVDPAGGSWYIEKLTDEVARKAWALFQDIEKQGGMLAALRAGVPQKLVAAVAADKDDGVAKRRTGIVGTNLFPNLKEKFLVPAPVVSIAAERAVTVKGRRPASAPAVKAGDVLALVSAASKGATIGQLAAATRGAAAEISVQPLVFKRLSAGIEELRAASESYAAKNGARPKVFLAKMGPVLQHKARADFSTGFFAVGGFEPLGKQTFETAEAAAEAAVASGAPVAVLCSTDDTYPVLAPVFAAAVKKAKPGMVVVLAGLPADKAVVEQFKAAGFDEFIHIRASVRDILAKLLKQIGALK